MAKADPSSRGQLDGIVAQLASRLSHMNDPAGVAASADEARAAVEAVLPRVASIAWSESDVRSMMATLASDRDFILRSDVLSADQVARALHSLASRRTRRHARLAS